MAVSSQGTQAPAHQRVYGSLRAMLLYGDLPPGRDVTLLGLAEQLGVSITPIREAVRRLIAERALQLHGNRRISVPRMQSARLEEIYEVRLLLEPELAKRAALRAGSALCSALEDADARLDEAIANGDISAYLRLNHEFHFAIYEAAESVVFLPVVESLWLQAGPFLRVVCGRYGTSSLTDHHKRAIAALSDNDAESFASALADDLAQGLDLLRSEARD